MCLIAFAVRAHHDYPLVVIANRDEAYARASQAAHAWGDAPGVFAGRDLTKGGTWLGVTRRGRFAAVTNVRSPTARREGRSRGALVREALEREGDARAWAATVDRDAYPSFNLLFGDATALHTMNESQGDAIVRPGIHGLSNARLDDAWPKVEAAKLGLTKLLSAGELDVEGAFDLLQRRDIAPDDSLPATGVPLALERALSPAFLVMEGYGTRASTVVAFEASGHIRFCERAFGPGGVPTTRVDVRLAPDGAGV